MTKNNSSNNDFTNNSDGFDLTGGTTRRKLTVTGADIALTGSGTNTYTFPSATDTLVGRASTDTLLNKTLTSPTLTTPTLGVATATSINKVAITAPATSATLTVADGKTLTTNNSLTLAGTDSTTMTFPSTSATIARTDAANTFTGHQTIEGVTSTGATGTGKFVFDTSPTLATPVINQFGTASGLGAAWSSWTPTWTNVTIGNATVAGSYIQIGKTVCAKLDVVFGSTSSFSGTMIFSLPVTSVALASTKNCIGNGIADDPTVATYPLLVSLQTTTTASLWVPNASTDTRLVNANATKPFTWASTFTLSVSFTYTVA